MKYLDIKNMKSTIRMMENKDIPFQTKTLWKLVFAEKYVTSWIKIFYLCLPKQLNTHEVQVRCIMTHTLKLYLTQNLFNDANFSFQCYKIPNDFKYCRIVFDTECKIYSYSYTFWRCYCIIGLPHYYITLSDFRRNSLKG